MNPSLDAPQPGARAPGLALVRGKRLVAVLRTNGVRLESLAVSGISRTHIQISGPDLPVQPGSVVELELSDDTLKLSQSVLVESRDAFGFLGRLIQPSEVFVFWIIGDADQGMSTP